MAQKPLSGGSALLKKLHIIPIRVPLLDQWRKYKWEHLYFDFLGGLTMLFLLIPQGIAYSTLAGMPPIFGLYSSIYPLIFYAPFATSYHLSQGPMALTSLMLGQSIQKLGYPEESQEWQDLIFTMSLIVACLHFFVGLFGMGSITYFISPGVMSAFLTASAFVIAINQINPLFGVKAPSDYNTPPLKIYYLLSHLNDTEAASFLLGVTSIGFIYLAKYWKPYYQKILSVKPDSLASLDQLQRFFHSFPALAVAVSGVFSWINIVLVVLGSILAYFLLRSGVAVWVVGEIPFGLPIPNPRFVMSPFSDFKSVVVDTFPMAFATFAGNWALAVKYSQMSLEYHEKLAMQKKLSKMTSPQNDPQTPTRQSRKVQSKKDTENEEEHFSPLHTKSRHEKGKGKGKFTSSSSSPPSSSSSVPTFHSAYALGPYKVDANQELVASGFGNLVGILLGQSFMVSAGLGRTVVSVGTGTVSQFSSIITGILMFILLAVLMGVSKTPGLSIITEVFAALPKSVVAAVIMASMPSMMDWEAFGRSWQLSMTDFRIMVATFLATIFFGVSEGLILGVVLSVFTILFPVSFPPITILGRLAYSDENPLTDLQSSKTQQEETRLAVLSATKEGEMRLLDNKLGSMVSSASSHSEDHVFYKNIQRFPQAHVVPGYFILRMEASPCFVNIEALKLSVRKILQVLTKLRLEHYENLEMGSRSELDSTRVPTIVEEDHSSTEDDASFAPNKSQKKKERKTPLLRSGASKTGKSHKKSQKNVSKKRSDKHKKALKELDLTDSAQILSLVRRFPALYEEPVRAVVLDASAWSFIDYQAIDTLISLRKELQTFEHPKDLRQKHREACDKLEQGLGNTSSSSESVGISLYIAEARGVIRDSLQFAFLSGQLDPFHFFLTVHDALEHRLPPLSYLRDYVPAKDIARDSEGESDLDQGAQTQHRRRPQKRKIRNSTYQQL